MKTPLKAFYVGCSGSIWCKLVEQLSSSDAILPIIWTADLATSERIMNDFSDCKYINDVSAAYETNLEEDEASEVRIHAISTKLLRALSVDETIAMAMMDRFDSGNRPLPYETKRRIWHGLIRLWYARLTYYQPDIVFFPTAPHMVYDWVIYAICKQLGIRTIMFERTSIPGKMLSISEFEKGSQEYRDALQKVTKEECGKANQLLDERCLEQIRSLRQTDCESLPPNYEKKLQREGILGKKGRQKQPSILRQFIWEVNRAAYILLKQKLPPQNYALHEQDDGQLRPANKLEWLSSRWCGQGKKRKLKKFLGQIQETSPPEQPFVLYALHYQPERAVVPMASILSDQLLIIDMLSRSLPMGWKLVVKEHPWQLVEFGRGELGRTLNFYQQIAAYSNVLLCDANLSTTDFLTKCQAVATVTGSLGWQAIACQKPVLTFGAAWYRDCPGSFPVEDISDCEKAFNKITADYVFPEFAAEHSLLALQKCCVEGYIEEKLEAIAHLDEESASYSMIKSIMSALEKT